MTEYLITWPQCKHGTLIRRYQRFLADIALDDGTMITAHCPNSGRMLGCSDPGRAVAVSRSTNPARKFSHTWELIEMPTSLVLINTQRTNAIVKQALDTGLIPELNGYSSIKAEVRCSEHSRIDFLLTGQGKPPCFVEVKSCTLVEDGLAMFPDAVTTRGLKHLRELELQLRGGMRCMVFFLVQRTDACSFMPADRIDAVYGQELRRIHSLGLEICTYTTQVTHEGIALNSKIPCLL
ncbi:MAG TPA: DNA/RNA nuclease SfsA [Deltaproteobacteria bacterium]|nr:DNA/RNA nuclease SfsA [Deltaproteobacteria bacterium]